MKRLIFVLVVTFALAHVAFSQSAIILEIPIPSKGMPAGASRPPYQEGARDADGDGVDDLAILSPRDPASGQATGKMTVKSGIATATGVSEAELLAGFQLHQNYPNPFNPSTMISYILARHDHVQLTIFNTLGQTVRTLVNEHIPAGEYSLIWDGRDTAGRFVSSGPFFYRLKAGEAVQMRRMLFLK